jgi:hypothetical protein
VHNKIEHEKHLLRTVVLIKVLTDMFVLMYSLTEADSLSFSDVLPAVSIERSITLKVVPYCLLHKYRRFGVAGIPSELILTLPQTEMRKRVHLSVHMATLRCAACGNTAFKRGAMFP